MMIVIIKQNKTRKKTVVMLERHRSSMASCSHYVTLKLGTIFSQSIYLSFHQSTLKKTQKQTKKKITVDHFKWKKALGKQIDSYEMISIFLCFYNKM